MIDSNSIVTVVVIQSDLHFVFLFYCLILQQGYEAAQWGGVRLRWPRVSEGLPFLLPHCTVHLRIKPAPGRVSSVLGRDPDIEFHWVSGHESRTENPFHEHLLSSCCFLFLNVFLIIDIYMWSMFILTHSTSLEVCKIQNGSPPCHVLTPDPQSPVPTSTRAHIPKRTAWLRTWCVVLPDFFFLFNHRVPTFLFHLYAQQSRSVATLHMAIRIRAGYSPTDSK